MKAGKKGHLLPVMFFMAIVTYMIVNSAVNSVDQTLFLVQEIPLMKTMIVKDQDGELYEKLQNAQKTEKHISEIYPYIYEIPTKARGLENSQQRELSVKACAKQYEDYLVQGKLPAQGEILLPQYMYLKNGKTYTDGSQYIGQTITLLATDYNGVEQEFSCTVSGTYNNVYAVTGDNMALLNAKDAVSFSEMVNEGIEKELQKAMKASGDYDKSHYIGFEMKYYYAVVADSYDNREQLRSNLNSSIGVYGQFEVQSWGTLSEVFVFVRYIGMTLTVLLLAVVIIVLVITIGNDIRRRKKEMALYMVQGYRKNRLLLMLGTEYLLSFVPALLIALLAAVGILMAGNAVIQNLLSIEFQVIHLELSLKALAISLVILALLMCLAVYTASKELKKIDLLKEIRAEG